MSFTDSFRATLSSLQDECPQVLGAVLATSEGLVLAACGELTSDAAAASAVHLAEQVDRCLGLLSGESGEAMLIWGQSERWCLMRVSARCVLMARAGADCRAGALKLVVHQAGLQLAPSLAGLEAAVDAAEDGEAPIAGPDCDPAYYAPA